MKRIYSRTIEKPGGFLLARWSAGAKAFETALPKGKRVLTDPLARYYAGGVGMGIVAAMQAINPSIRKAIVLRARYMDDYAEASIAEGCRQVVLLGAGYDSRYLRTPGFRDIPVFELDLESTQQVKKALTRRLFGCLPANVTYIATNLAVDSISQKLLAAGFRRELKTLFIWEGVTLFLNEEIIAETFGHIAELGPGHRLTFDFVPAELVDDETDYRGNRDLLRWCASINEPLTFGCSAVRMRQMLCAAGFGNVQIRNMREAHRMYGGDDAIEDSYLFATAEVGHPLSGNGSLVSRSPGGLILPGSLPGTALGAIPRPDA